MSNESNISDEMNSIGYFYYLLYIYKNTYLHSIHKKPTFNDCNIKIKFISTTSKSSLYTIETL